jgi:hypothetical protein
VHTRALDTKEEIEAKSWAERGHDGVLSIPLEKAIKACPPSPLPPHLTALFAVEHGVKSGHFVDAHGVHLHDLGHLFGTAAKRREK